MLPARVDKFPRKTGLSFALEMYTLWLKMVGSAFGAVSFYPL